MTQQPNAGRWLPESQLGFLSLLAHCQLPHILRSQLDPDDLVQETVGLAIQNMDKCNAKTEAEFRGWLRTILRNCLVAKIRRIRPQVVVVDEPDSASTPSERMMREEQLARLAKELAALPTKQQQAVRLHHLDGYSSAEVGRQMGLSVDAVSGLLGRAFKTLRRILVEPDRK